MWFHCLTEIRGGWQGYVVHLCTHNISMTTYTRTTSIYIVRNMEIPYNGEQISRISYYMYLWKLDSNDCIVYNGNDCAHPQKLWRLVFHENWTLQNFLTIQYVLLNKIRGIVRVFLEIFRIEGRLIERHTLDLTNMSAWDYYGCWPLNYAHVYEAYKLWREKIPPPPTPLGFM